MTRKGRIHYHKSDNPYPMEMIQQGWSALESLNRFPALTSWQVCKLLFLNTPNSQGVMRSEDAARAATNRYCLRRLKDQGLVAVKPIPRLDNPLAKWEMNYLTKQGHALLTQHRSEQGFPTTPFRSPANLNYQTINLHAMGVIDAGISAMAGAGKYGMELSVWLDDVEIRSLSKQSKLIWPMEPDALLVIAYGQTRRAFFLEVDRGTESVASARANSFSTKMGKYKHYFQSLRQVDPLLGELPQPDVMIITTSQQRLQNLQTAAAKSGGRSAYWFTTQELLEPPYNFFGVVWQRIGLDGYHSPTQRFAS